MILISYMHTPLIDLLCPNKMGTLLSIYKPLQVPCISADNIRRWGILRKMSVW